MFLANGTRPDIAYAIGRLSQHLAGLADIHLMAAKHLLRYLKGTANARIIYRAAKGDVSSSFHGFADAAYANASGHRSTSGNVFFLAGGPVSWCRKKQGVVAQSTTEAEYMSLAEASKQVV